jgi:hypothetical protein
MARLFQERLVEITQAVLMVVSLVGVINATRAETPGTPQPQYLAGGRSSQQSADRRYSDLARFDRKRREDAQRRSGRVVNVGSTAATDGKIH